MNDDIVYDLIGWMFDHPDQDKHTSDLMLRACNEIERLREALRPLADLWLYPDDLGEGFSEDIDDAQKEEVFILRSDIRRARAALGEEK